MENSFKVLLIGLFTVNLLVGFYLYVNADQASVKLLKTNSFKIDWNLNSWQRSIQWYDYLRKGKFDSDHQGIIRDPEYCEKVAKFRQAYPLEIGQDGLPKHKVFFSDYKKPNLVKSVMRSMGKLALESHVVGSDEYNTPLEYLDPSILVFYHKSTEWHYKHRIGEEFLCENQRYNHIPGNHHMIYKDEAARSARVYGKYYFDREHCFDPWKFMPRTYDLSNKEECREILGILKSDTEPEKVKWIMKVARGLHNAEGVSVLDQNNTQKLLTKYDYGNKCGLVESKSIVQAYISDPLLINGKKFDFRVYLMVASTDPLVVLYHEGFLRVSMAPYSQDSKEQSAHITNTALTKDYLKNHNATNSEYQEAMTEQMWTFDKFQSYMQAQGLVGPYWIQNYVKPAMKKSMLHLILMNYHKWLQHPGVWELFGVDFLFDKNLHLWFLEVNRSPAMQATTEEKGRIQSEMVQDELNIQFALMNQLDITPFVESSGFEWVYDGRKQGPDKYMGVLESECL